MKINSLLRKHKARELPKGRGTNVLELDREAVALMILLVERKRNIKRVLKEALQQA